MGKSLSGGMAAVSGCVADKDIMQHVGPGDHGGTFSGNPLAMAACTAAINTLLEEDMIDNSLKMGEILKSELQKIECDSIEEVRGRGLFIGLGLKQSANVNSHDFAKILAEHGLLARTARDKTIRLIPPLVIKEHEIHEAVDIIRAAS